MAMTSADHPWMSRALELAARGRGWVEPNPLVGAVIVRDGQVVAEGWHQRFGQAHAERHALDQAGAAARGGTLYVTLEPCCHHGKTPPCTDAIIAAGIRRVVAAMLDPFPAVAGQGIRRLQHAGIDVQLGPGEAEARRLNAPYLKLLATGRPYVHAKWAMSLDGKIATRTGDSRWLSSESSRRRAHELRGRVDAVAVGIGTVLADDPLLTARPPGPRTATRIVVDRLGRLPLASQLARTAREVPVLVAVSHDLDRQRCQELEAVGCEVLPLPGHDRLDLLALLDELGRRRMTNLLVEGGAALLGSFFDADAIDEVHVFLAPKLVGGEQARGPLAGLGIDRIAAARPVSGWEVELLESDVYLHGQLPPRP
jgi:diaminohydroxyphosphoribosylaminopyrimidine deaminase/5-amino-6-(5-phosphoribosylamino)uracil reductase